MDFEQLNAALKYHQEQERKAFEDAIDANPLEATNHLVYADWLDEHGESEEAAFRRAMGEWHNKHRFDKGYGSLRVVPNPEPTGHRNRWAGYDLDPYPTHEWELAEHTDGPGGVLLDRDFIRHAHHNRYAILATHPTDSWHAVFHSYRHLENALRDAFTAGRSKQ